MARPRKPNRKSLPPNLYDNGTGYFYFRDPRNGKKLGLGRDKARAMSEARAANSKLADMAPSTAVKWVTGDTSMTFAEWVPVYTKEWQEKKAGQGRPLSNNTLSSSKSYLNRIQEAPFAWKSLPAITTVDIAQFLDAVTKKSGMSSANQMRIRLGHMFRHAESKGLIDTGKSPVNATEAPVPEAQRRRLLLEEFLAIRAKAMIDKPWFAHAMDIALLTGAREEDISKLKFSNFIEGSLYLITGKGRGRTRLQLNGKIHLKAVKMSIADVVKACRGDVVSQYLIHHGRKTSGKGTPGGKVSKSYISEMFKTIRNELGITGELPEGLREEYELLGELDLPHTPPTFHEIRSLAERLYEAEYSQAYAQQVLGHKNIKQTADYNDLRGTGWKVIEAR